MGFLPAVGAAGAGRLGGGLHRERLGGRLPGLTGADRTSAGPSATLTENTTHNAAKTIPERSILSMIVHPSFARYIRCLEAVRHAERQQIGVHVDRLHRPGAGLEGAGGFAERGVTVPGELERNIPVQ